MRNVSAYKKQKQSGAGALLCPLCVVCLAVPLFVCSFPDFSVTLPGNHDAPGYYEIWQYEGSIPVQDSIHLVRLLEYLHIDVKYLRNAIDVENGRVTALFLTAGNIRRYTGNQYRSAFRSFLGLREIPELIGKLDALRELDIHLNELHSLPPALEKLEHLRYLDAADNALRGVDTGIGNLRSLYYLDLSANPIANLPSSFGRLESLGILDLEETEFDTFPCVISMLPGLFSCDIGRSKLATLPPCIAGLKSLKYLNLGSNSLAELPDAFGELAELRTLHLYHNRLTYLPSSITKLDSLGVLSLAGNQICSPTDSIDTWLSRVSPDWRSQQGCDSNTVVESIAFGPD